MVVVHHVTVVIIMTKLVVPHVSPQDEKQRIEALGGCVIWFGTWRVNGSLSVSRAIGNEPSSYLRSKCRLSLVVLTDWPVVRLPRGLRAQTLHLW